MKKLATLMIALVAMVSFAATASAFTLDTVSATWDNWVGGSNVTTTTGNTTYGNEVEDQVRWGIPFEQPNQSGLGFTGIVPDTLPPTLPTLTVAVDEVFAVGQLRHFNYPVGLGTSSSLVDLTLELGFAELASDQSFTFTFDIDETPNGDIPGGVPDVITFPSSLPSQSFNYNGTDYTLELLGFGDSADNYIDSFISPEGTINDTLLFARITENVIPEPTTMLLLGSGLLGLAGAGFRKKRK